MSLPVKVRMCDAQADSLAAYHEVQFPAELSKAHLLYAALSHGFGQSLLKDQIVSTMAESDSVKTQLGTTQLMCCRKALSWQHSPRWHGYMHMVEALRTDLTTTSTCIRALPDGPI